MRILRLHLKSEYWHAIQRGEKPLEYRLATTYWQLRLRSKVGYDEIHLMLGYPKKGDESKTLRRKWLGCPALREIRHPHFGRDPVLVYAIDVSQPVIEVQHAKTR